jgi:hypothetical protein
MHRNGAFFLKSSFLKSRILDFMFEQEIDLVKKHLLEQLFSSQQYIYIHEILNNPGIDDAYKSYFNAEVSWWIYEEQSLRQSNPRFDIDAPEIRQTLSDLDAKYRSVARFDHEELTATVDAAAKARLNFLCRPRTALKWFVFRGEPTKPLNEILLRMDFFSDHKYLIDGFKEWSKQRRIDRQPAEILSVVEFERIIERIDNEAIFDLSPQQFTEILAPLFSYFQVPSTRIPANTLPTEALIIFLDDKGVTPISQTLENLLYNDELRYITKDRFLYIVDNIVQEMDEQENSIPESTLPLDFETIPVKNDNTFFKKETIADVPAPITTLESPEAKKNEEDEFAPENEKPEELLKESEKNVEVHVPEVVLKEEVLKEDSAEETLQEETLQEDSQEEIIKEEILKEDSVEDVLKEDILNEEIPESRSAEASVEISSENGVVETENVEIAEVISAENTNENAEIPQEIEEEPVLKNDEKADKSGEEPVFDSFLEDIHRFKNTESVIGFDGSLPEEIIEQTILQETVDTTEIPETEKHQQKLAEQSATKLPSISQFIDSKHIEKFTKKLFKRDNVEYVRFLKELEAIPQWKEAARRIDRHLAQNGIEPDSSIAKEFRELVHKRYGK